jgi:[ribosomal protein S5]-alanine N-acetyltransferase
MPSPLFTIEERRVAHATELFEVLRDQRLYEFLDEDPPASVHELELKLARSESRLSPDGKEHWLNWVVRAESGAIAGYVQATVEETKETNVAYVFSPTYQGQGIASAAVRKMLEIVASQYGPSRFFIITEAQNQRSLRLAHRLGFSPAPQDVSARRHVGTSELLFWKPASPRSGRPSGYPTRPPTEPDVPN